MLSSSLGEGAAGAAADVLAGSPPLRFSNIQTTREAFDQIFTVFLVLGTIVGVVVLAYMIWKAYKYREGADIPEEERADPPELGELPGEGEGGKKLFLSFSLSAIIVLSLIFWTYGTLLHISSTPQPPGEQQLNVTAEGFQFGWAFVYPNGHRETGTLRVPNGTVVSLDVTSQDVFHNLGLVPFERKADAIPGQTTHMWVLPTEVTTYENGAVCYELCGAGHSQMTADIVVMEQEAFDEWYDSTGSHHEDASGEDGNASTAGTGSTLPVSAATPQRTTVTADRTTSRRESRSDASVAVPGFAPFRRCHAARNGR